LKEYGGGNYPTNKKELFNLRHSSLRVTVERAFGALKNRFLILNTKPFHPCKTQVKLVLACRIIHNWIVMHGKDELFPDATSWVQNPTTKPVDDVVDNAAWGLRRDAIADDMWNNRGHYHS
jgi:hypothetical protein